MKCTFRMLTLAAVLVAPYAVACATEEGMGDGMGMHGKQGKGGHGFEQMMDRMREMDANKDGFVDKEEFLKSAEKRFSKMDKEGAGKISLKDMEDKHAERMKERAAQKKEEGNSQKPTKSGEDKKL